MLNFGLEFNRSERAFMKGSFLFSFQDKVDNDNGVSRKLSYKSRKKKNFGNIT